MNDIATDITKAVKPEASVVCMTEREREWFGTGDEWRASLVTMCRKSACRQCSASASIRQSCFVLSI